MTTNADDFPYPLNVLRLVLALESEPADALHYGLFERPDESLADAQARSTAILFERLPPPPRRILEVGIGLGQTLDRLLRLGYDAVGITPDAAQARIARQRFGPDLPVRESTFEAFEDSQPYDVLIFQESSQYIESAALWNQTRRNARPGARTIVLDEFALLPVDRPGALHRLDEFLRAAAPTGFVLEEEVDLSRQAAPTVDWFLRRLPAHRDRVARELGVDGERFDALLESGAAYRDLYESGRYGYRLLRFRAG
ncbi:MAG TPA: methyltransferase domain-containing protein [Thermoanaerobaculia bacterium]|nr:methyltransferase domain-containing protein [Thermoanaerobaculia bacterium]